MITRHIADLLYHHECVIVPGLGGFIKAYRPAQIKHTTHEFSPPSGTIAFNSGLSVNDGLLANYISSVENTTYREALYEIKKWAETCLVNLNKGETVTLDGIGDLFMNTSGKFEFKPSLQVNFNTDSFGLAAFIAKPAHLEPAVLPEIQVNRHASRSAKYRHFIPETLKWAAVLAPFVAFVLWGSINGNVLNNYVHNYTGMYSWSRSTPGKTAAVHAVSPPVILSETAKEIVQSPAGILAAENIAFNPGLVSYTELDLNKIKIAEPVPASEAIQTEQNYYIIGGAFRDHDNALGLISKLQEQGYPASVVDTTPAGLYIVSMKGFNEYGEAIAQLDMVKKAGFPSSWILKNKKR